jgi:hypothetical protein
MGTLSEFFRYLQVKPSQLQDFKKTMSHITVTSKMKKVRKQLKLYDKTKEEVR